jgi:hypothetical protein
MASSGKSLEQRLIELGQQRPLPPELAVAAPRPDVWGTTGYLRYEHYRTLLKPLLIHGFATTGLVYDYEELPDTDGRTVGASYAWLDPNGLLRTHALREEFDPMHAAMASGIGTMVVSVDAELALGKPLTILQDPGSELHVVYEALKANPRWKEEAAATLSIFYLQWEPGEDFTRAVASRKPGGEPLFTLEREAAPSASWRLHQDGQLHLRSPADQPLSQGGVRTLVDAQGQELGRLTASDRRLHLTLPRQEFSITEEPKGLWMVRDADHSRVLTISPYETGERQWELVARTPIQRSLGELLMLAFTVGYDGPAPFPEARSPFHAKP